MAFNPYNYDKFSLSDTRENVEKEFRYALFDDLLCQVEEGEMDQEEAFRVHMWVYPQPALENPGEYGTI